MDIDGAARATLELARKHADAWRDPPLPEMSLDHLEGMMKRWPHDGSATKQCRWLGWMQATVVAMAAPHVTLEDMKRINAAHARDISPQERLDGRRRAIADRTFEDHDFGEGIHVADASGWSMVCGQFRRDVFFEDPDGGDSLAGRFSILFRLGCEEVERIEIELPDTLLEALDRRAAACEDLQPAP